MSATTTILLTFSGYMVLLLAIGWWGDRRFGQSYEGFVSADKSLGGWVAAISAAASSESGWVMLGLSGLGYKHGLGSYWAAGGCALGFIVTALFVVRQLRASAAGHEVLTLGDYLAKHLGRGGRAIRSLTAALVGFFMVVYVIAQFTSAGKQMSGMGLMSYHSGVLVGALIIGIYVLIGGYAAVCWTDFLQGLLMLAVLVAFPVYALVLVGGFGPLGEALRQAEIDTIWVGGAGPTSAAIGFALTYFGFSLGYPGMPHSIIRYITIKDEREARRAAWIGAVYGTFVLFGSASIGVVGRALLPSLCDPEQVLPAFTATFLPPVIGGVILAAVSAAIMSTADSQLMMAASSLVHDLWYRVLRRRSAEGRSMVRQTRAVIGVLTVAALLVALFQVDRRDPPAPGSQPAATQGSGDAGSSAAKPACPERKKQRRGLIDTLVLFAWGCLGAAFSPVIILCLYWRRFTWHGAVASFVVGPATTVIWQLVGLSANLHGLIPGTTFSVLAAVLASLAAGAKGRDRV